MISKRVFCILTFFYSKNIVSAQDSGQFISEMGDKDLDEIIWHTHDVDLNDE